MWLLEDSLPIIIVSVIGGAILAGALIQTGKQTYLYGLIGWLVACFVMLSVEYVYVTDAERIEATVHEIAAAIRANNPNKVASYVSNDHPNLQALAKLQVRTVKIEAITVKQNLDVSTTPESSPPVGIARFNFVVHGQLKKSQAVGGRFAAFCVLQFKKDDDGEWRVIDYQFFDPVKKENGSQITPPGTPNLVNMQ